MAIKELINEHDLYPVHEEDSVPVTPRHTLQQKYVLDAVQTELPDLWVTGDVCLYWERGNNRKYVAPDITVVGCPPPVEMENVYLAWSDPPLVFVAEFGSRSTFKKDTGPKLGLYEKTLKVPEYLYANPPRRDLRFWRMVNGLYQQIALNAQGRVWSEQLELWFGFAERGFLRIYTDDGRMLLTHTEEAARANEEAARANEKAARAEAETQLRRELEQRVAEMAAEIERLKRDGDKLANSDGSTGQG